jgi:hypothetical protein
MIGLVDEWTGEDDPGYDVYEIGDHEFREVSKKIAQKFNYPQAALAKNTGQGQSLKDSSSKLPEGLKFPEHEDSFYPCEYEDIVYDCFNLKIIFNREKTGF